jgi:hypothetical protein
MAQPRFRNVSVLARKHLCRAQTPQPAQSILEAFENSGLELLQENLGDPAKTTPRNVRIRF